MKTYRVETVEKKNVRIRTRYSLLEDGMAPERFFYTEEWYRWGSCLVESDDGPPVQSEDPYTVPFELDDYITEDQNADDGCTFSFEFDQINWTEEEQAEIEEMWDNDEFYEKVYVEDNEISYWGPLKVTEE
jgi:hypothetical protein